jgi:hypothetical protein
MTSDETRSHINTLTVKLTGSRYYLYDIVELHFGLLNILCYMEILKHPQTIVMERKPTYDSQVAQLLDIIISSPIQQQKTISGGIVQDTTGARQ